MSDNIKRFLCYLANKNSFETGIDIFLSYLWGDVFFMILEYIERCVGRSCVGGTFFLVPFSPHNFYRSFCVWEILLSYGFIVSKSRNRKWEKFAPFFCCDHVRKYLWEEYFILFLSVLFIQDAIRTIAERCTSKTVFTTITTQTVHTIRTVTGSNTKMCPISTLTRRCLIAELALFGAIIIHRIRERNIVPRISTTL